MGRVVAESTPIPPKFPLFIPLAAAYPPLAPPRERLFFALLSKSFSPATRRETDARARPVRINPRMNATCEAEGA